MTGDIVARLEAADPYERARMAAELVPEYADQLNASSLIIGIALAGIADGYTDDEVVDALDRFRRSVPTYPDGWSNGPPLWQPGPGLNLREKRAGEALLAALRDQRPLRRDRNRDPEAARMAGLSKGRAAQQVEKERKRQLVQECAAQGLSQNQTARKTGISRRSVQRYWPH